MNDYAAQYRQLYHWLLTHSPLLAVTHERPDGDALGSLAGAATLWRSQGLAVDLYVGSPVPENYREFMPADLLVGTAVDWARYGGVWCLDCASAERVCLPGQLSFGALPRPAANLDHHEDNPRFGEVAVVSGASAATAALLADFAATLSLPVSGEVATLLLIGLLMDTGGLRFNNTSAAALRTAAWLRERGAAWDRVITAMFYNEPYNRVQLRAWLAAHTQLAHGGKLAYFLLTPELLASFGVANADTEDLVDVLRDIRGVEVFCRLQAVPAGVRFSLRSKTRAVPVLPLAHRLGGGGHALAAGALLKDGTLAEAEKLLLSQTEGLFGGST